MFSFYIFFYFDLFGILVFFFFSGDCNNNINRYKFFIFNYYYNRKLLIFKLSNIYIIFQTKSLNKKIKNI